MIIPFLFCFLFAETLACFGGGAPEGYPDWQYKKNYVQDCYEDFWGSGHSCQLREQKELKHVHFDPRTGTEFTEPVGKYVLLDKFFYQLRFTYNNIDGCLTMCSQPMNQLYLVVIDNGQEHSRLVEFHFGNSTTRQRLPLLEDLPILQAMESTWALMVIISFHFDLILLHQALLIKIVCSFFNFFEIIFLFIVSIYFHRFPRPVLV